LDAPHPAPTCTGTRTASTIARTVGALWACPVWNRPSHDMNPLRPGFGKITGNDDTALERPVNHDAARSAPFGRASAPPPGEYR
jgi:hypothetical protein